MPSQRRAAALFACVAFQVGVGDVAAQEAGSAEETQPAAATRAAAAMSPAAPALSEESDGSGEEPTDHAVVEVTVRVISNAERLRGSAEAVHVVEMEEEQRETADLGEVLARTQGVSVRRAGGLGSDTRFSLNGLTDDQIRFFLDGVPLELAGYPFGIANVSVNLVERVEIYRGVVPIRFGADALGGAVNLTSDDRVYGTRASASYQAGSFGTQRLTLSTGHGDASSGWFTRVGGFFDHADNDYPMDVEVPDDVGRLTPARVYRFHDAYRAVGGNVEAGLVDQPWAERLVLRAFATDYGKEVQHNAVMTQTYGDVALDELSAGGTLRYESYFGGSVAFDAIGGYAYTVTEFSDLGTCVYNWFGQCLRQRAQPGEIAGRPRDSIYWEHAAYFRTSVDWQLHPQQALGLSVSPTFTFLHGDERRQANPDARDPLSAERTLSSSVIGVDYRLQLADDRLENVLFAKDYLQLLRSDDPLPSGSFRQRDRQTHRFGVGDSLRYTFTEQLYAKASYEWATRLPRADEIFGNAFPIVANLDLEPEVSHNANLQLVVDASHTPLGGWRGDVNGFLRDADQLIVLVPGDDTATYQNVLRARALGVEGAAGWTSPGAYVVLDGNLTYLDFRNRSSSGAFAAYRGDRIPNRPNVFATVSARLQAREVASPRDELALTWTTRYVGDYFRGWEGVGARDLKLTIDAQRVHSLALSYFVEGARAALSFTGEAQNLTDERAFDFYGVERPGRSFYFKVTASNQ